MVAVPLDEDLLALLPGAYPAPAQQVRELIVLELFRRRLVTSGRGAELLGLGREEFILYAGRLGIAYLDLDDVEIERELKSSRAVS